MNRWLPFVLVLCSACGETAGEALSVPCFGRGDGETSFVRGAWQVTLERAEVAFGPLYFCAASVPSEELCESAVVELDRSVTIDALDTTPQPLRPLRGTTGVVRSALFDYGISWPLTFRSPRPSDAAPGGHSARFEGRATDGARTLVFTADVDVLPNAPGRLTSSVVTEHTLDVQSRLDVTLSPSRWWQSVDFDALAASAFADVDPDDPEPTSSAHIQEGSDAHGALVHELSAGARPRFVWSEDP